ncbi:histone-lysine N-methyltransferase H3 lysine-36 specific [Biomphalaria pfeifferi]|uniref:Histone-lysine N-methyltransferase H3 lysine-36 specific n=1 Tax=Biomphalaria pfeifferi TaxID=112525 RepID=A0AAD8FMS9_BIOPF|nr:histone-lysine N-methyltransferase H3 lysine-36 specific [Biomphalaria pfeifferi]
MESSNAKFKSSEEISRSTTSNIKVDKDLAQESLKDGNLIPSSRKVVYLRLSQFPSKANLHKMIQDADQNEASLRKSQKLCSRKKGSKYQLGDMFWAKIRGYPFWPCMISRDPFNNMHTKSRHTTDEERSSHVFHVQFFGRGYYRSWVNETSLLEYHGREHFFEMAKYGPEDILRKCWRPSDYKVSPAWFPSWHLAVIEAERAFKLSIEDRRDQCTFQYMYRIGRKEYSVQKMVERVRRKLFGLPEDASCIDEGQEEKETSKQVRIKKKIPKGNFDVFYERRARILENLHPDWNMLTVLKHLQEEWAELSDIEKCLYKVRSSIASHVHKYVTGGIKKHKEKTRPKSRSSPSVTRVEITGLRQIKINPESLDLQLVQLANVLSGFETKQECKVCRRKGRQLQICKGACHQYIHLSCGILKDTGVTFCSECSAVEKVCFVCKNPDGTTLKCNDINCCMYYHEDCATKYQQTKGAGSAFVCLLHKCSTCSIDKANSPLVQCILCPTAYHPSELCIAAGSIMKTSNTMVCSKHYKPVQQRHQLDKFNANRCLDCPQDKVVNCSLCPAAYCSDCMGEGQALAKTKKSKNTWLCSNCKIDKRPLYGDIVWAKVKFFKWWPAEVCHPSHIPDKFQLKTCQAGRFPIRFFGSYDYAWIHQGRMLPYGKVKEALDCGYNSGDLQYIYRRAIAEAEVAHQYCLTFRQSGGNVVASSIPDLVNPVLEAQTEKKE